MKCMICRHGETRAGKTTVTLERNGATFVIHDVPAQVCENCGEEYVDETVSMQLLKTAETQAREGVKVDIRDYAAA